MDQRLTESEAKVLVEDHGDFVSTRFPNGESKTLSWSDLLRFEIQTNDSGPWGWDVWFVLVGDRDQLSFPLGATGQNEIFAKLEKVTGMSQNQLIDGMNSTTNQTFVTWEKQMAG